MRIDIGGGGKVAVAKPFLDLLHEDAVGQQQTGTAVTKIVIANFPQAMLLQQLCKGFGEIMWGEQLSQFHPHRCTPDSPCYSFCRTYTEIRSAVSAYAAKAP